VFGVQTDPVLPFWFIGPLALLTMLVIAGHLLAMRAARARVPASRYRVRTVNGGLMLTVTPLLAVAFGVVPPSESRVFVMVWFACMGLLAIVMVLAAVDALNNIRLMLVERARLREEQASEALSVLHGLRRDVRGGSPQGRGGDG